MNQSTTVNCYGHHHKNVLLYELVIMCQFYRNSLQFFFKITLFFLCKFSCRFTNHLSLSVEKSIKVSISLLKTSKADYFLFVGHSVKAVYQKIQIQCTYLSKQSNRKGNLKLQSLIRICYRFIKKTCNKSKMYLYIYSLKI